MSFDADLAERFNPSVDLPVLRVYGWKPHTISLGVHQSLDDFDISKIRQDGVGIVRRPTGGRAIFHAHELTYSIILSGAGQSARAIYLYLSRGILAALHLMGIEAELSGVDEFLPGLHHNPLSIPCFSTSTRSEIRCRGKKIVGSAQRRYGDTILQHGSFLLGRGHRRISEYLSPAIHSMKTAIDDHLLERTTEAETILNRPVSFEEAATSLRKGLEGAYGITFIPYEAGSDQKTVEVQQLVQTP